MNNDRQLFRQALQLHNDSTTRNMRLPEDFGERVMKRIDKQVSRQRAMRRIAVAAACLLAVTGAVILYTRENVPSPTVSHVSQHRHSTGNGDMPVQAIQAETKAESLVSAVHSDCAMSQDPGRFSRKAESVVHGEGVVPDDLPAGLAGLPENAEPACLAVGPACQSGEQEAFVQENTLAETTVTEDVPDGRSDEPVIGADLQALARINLAERALQAIYAAQRKAGVTAGEDEMSACMAERRIIAI